MSPRSSDVHFDLYELESQCENLEDKYQFDRSEVRLIIRCNP